MLCLVLCGTQLVFFFGCVLSCCHVLCEHVTWVFSLAACSCLVLHMAGDLFYWPYACVFVLCEHMAFVLVFCVPCALMSIVLTPPILLSDYWFISSTSLSSSFAPFIISLCFQSCASSSLMLPCPVLSCPVLSCPALPCTALHCPALSCPVLPCPALPCPALPCPALASCPVFPLRGSFSWCFVLLFSNKAHSPAQLSPRLILSPQPWHKKLKEWILHPMTPLK